MAVLGVDDTDSRAGGMCTTWIATEIVDRLPTERVERTYLIRLHPAIEHKTRGNGAVAVVADVSARELFEIAAEVVESHAVVEDPQTNPGIVVMSIAGAARNGVRGFGRRAVRTTCTRAEAETLLKRCRARSRSWGNGRGIIGATAAIGAVGAHGTSDPVAPVFDDWTYEYIAYREADQWGTQRDVEVPASVGNTPGVWDTRDPISGDPVCVPRSPCPVLYGIRGDDPDAIRSVSSALTGESVDRGRMFVTNQGTDAHLRPGRIGALEEGHSYRVRGVVGGEPTTGRGGHVSVPLEQNGHVVRGIAFSPTGRFRETVRELQPGDEVIACGEVSDGSIKLEKFGLVRRRLTNRSIPACPTCDRSMKSAGRGQGYRCRDCGTSAPGKRRITRDRDLDIGWYEVPPDARRHLAKPLARGGYTLPVFPTSG